MEKTTVPTNGNLASALAQQAERLHPALDGRATRAAQALAAGAVVLDGLSGGIVDSRNGRELPYIVDPDTRRLWRCNCADYQGALAGQPDAAPVIGDVPCCEHVTAIVIALEIGRGRQGELNEQ
jgi:hypothetical protein